MKPVSIEDYLNRPIFLHAVNNELHKAVGHPIDPKLLIKSIRIFSLLSSQSLFCNISQVYAVFHDCPEALIELTELSRAGVFNAHADYGSIEEFLESRVKKFDHAREHNPSFFQKPSPELILLPLSGMGKVVETTGFIENELVGLIESQKNFLHKTLDQNDQKVIRESEDWLSETLQNRTQEALTFDVFEQSQKVDMRPKAVGAVRRALSQAYIGSYCAPFESLTIWGYHGINKFDRFELLTGLNFKFAQSIFSATGIDQELCKMPHYGQFERLTCLATEELALFRKRYFELAVFLDNGIDVSSGYYSRNSQVSSNIQKILQTGTLRPEYIARSFRDRLILAATDIKKTTDKMSETSKTINEPKLYAFYPKPGNVAPKSFDNPKELPNDISSEGFNFSNYSPLMWSIATIVGLATFGVLKFHLHFLSGHAATFAIISFIVIVIAMLLRHPGYFYRRIAAAGLFICAFGGWNFTLNLKGGDLLEDSFLRLGSGSTTPVIIVGFLIFFTGLIADFLQRSGFKFGQ